MPHLKQLRSFVLVAARSSLTDCQRILTDLANAKASVSAGGVTAGRLVPVPEVFAAPPNGIDAVFPQRKQLPLRVRLWIDFLKHHYSQSDFWSRTR